MDTIEKLDKILDYLDNDSPKKEKMAAIQEAIDIDISIKDLDLIIRKLIQDQYVLESKGKAVKGQAPKNYYFITYDGVIFNRQGGYSNSLEIAGLNAERKRLFNRALKAGGWGALIIGVVALVELMLRISDRLCLLCFFSQ